jgi:hypothetical protein
VQEVGHCYVTVSVRQHSRDNLELAPVGGDAKDRHQRKTALPDTLDARIRNPGISDPKEAAGYDERISVQEETTFESKATYSQERATNDLKQANRNADCVVHAAGEKAHRNYQRNTCAEKE